MQQHLQISLLSSVRQYYIKFSNTGSVASLKWSIFIDKTGSAVLKFDHLSIIYYMYSKQVSVLNDQAFARIYV